MRLIHLFNVTEESTVIPVIRNDDEDEIIHTLEHPYCNIKGCPCGGPPSPGETSEEEVQE